MFRGQGDGEETERGREQREREQKKLKKVGKKEEGSGSLCQMVLRGQARESRSTGLSK